MFAGTILSQETALRDKITLKTGEVYTGEIVLKNDDIVMLKTDNGTRFQFPLSEIRIIEKENLTVNPKNDTISINPTQTNQNVSGVLELSGGISSAKFSFDPSFSSQASLIFGNKSILGQQTFLGIGVGINSSYITSNSSTISFLPVFLRWQTTLTKNRTAPFVGVDAGYSFAMNDDFGGGPFAKISVGITHKLNYKTSLIFGFYGSVNSISANLIETNSLGTFGYYAQTSLISYGAKMAFQF
jgi:hypothetical protein